MKGFVEIFLHDEGIRISAPARSSEELFLPTPVSDLNNRLARFVQKNGLRGLPVIFYIAEDLLSFKKLQLPPKTANVKEAVTYQLSMLVPYNDEILHSFSSIRQKDGYDISLYAVEAEKVEPFVEEVFEAGFEIIGLYPESQRYVTGAVKKEDWALFLSSGRISKVLVFSGNRLIDRLPCYHEPEYDAVQKLCNREMVYQSEAMEGEGFLSGTKLLAERPVLKEFNLLPATYKKPDYMRNFLVALCILNCIALLAVVGIKEYKIQQTLTHLHAEVGQRLPGIKEIETLRIKEKKLQTSLQYIESIEANFDILGFLDEVTEGLPENSYLDQIRMEKKGNSIQLQGYTEDLGELTEKLGEYGSAKLKSTRKRQNKTYFHVEIGLK